MKMSNEDVQIKQVMMRKVMYNQIERADYISHSPEKETPTGRIHCRNKSSCLREICGLKNEFRTAEMSILLAEFASTKLY